MMKHKPAELEGALLDAAVAKAEGYEWSTVNGRYFESEERAKDVAREIGGVVKPIFEVTWGATT
jgi:hypothetical protein